MPKHPVSLLTGDLLDEDTELTLAELCRACRMSEERVHEFVAQGIVDPAGGEPARWRFRSIAIRRVRCADRLERDLGVNAAGAALALDLLEELDALRARLARLRD